MGVEVAGELGQLARHGGRLHALRAVQRRLDGGAGLGRLAEPEVRGGQQAVREHLVDQPLRGAGGARQRGLGPGAGVVAEVQAAAQAGVGEFGLAEVVEPGHVVGAGPGQPLGGPAQAERGRRRVLPGGLRAGLGGVQRGPGPRAVAGGAGERGAHQVEGGLLVADGVGVLGQRGQDVRAQQPVVGLVGQAQRQQQVAPGQSVQSRVVRVAPDGQLGQRGGAEQAAAGGPGVAAGQQRGEAAVQVLHGGQPGGGAAGAAGDQVEGLQRAAEPGEVGGGHLQAAAGSGAATHRRGGGVGHQPVQGRAAQRARRDLAAGRAVLVQVTDPQGAQRTGELGRIVQELGRPRGLTGTGGTGHADVGDTDDPTQCQRQCLGDEFGRHRPAHPPVAPALHARVGALGVTSVAHRGVPNRAGELLVGHGGLLDESGELPVRPPCGGRCDVCTTAHAGDCRAASGALGVR
ncbi:hypothetical protein [Kitasatospora nipponensis]|uniref:hypothetical protein n=1 Tax=Kitasatospora nipponensis TaxID=258049 RepID=UPI0031DBA8F5